MNFPPLKSPLKFYAVVPTADWVELDGVGHAPQLEVPVEAAQMIVGSAG